MMTAQLTGHREADGRYTVDENPAVLQRVHNTTSRRLCYRFSRLKLQHKNINEQNSQHSSQVNTQQP